MRILLSSMIIVSAALVGCSTTQPASPNLAPSSEWITPEEAVIAAARAAPRGVPGTFAMRVLGTGTDGDRFFLNSEEDYRDQRNLTVAMSGQAAGQLAERLGTDPLVGLMNREILVRGSAVRTRIYFFANGHMTDKYYYQTHVNVDDASQVTVR